MIEKGWHKPNSLNDMQTSTTSRSLHQKSINKNITLDWRMDCIPMLYF